MNKKLLALLNQINAQKQVVIDLVNAGKLAEAKAEKEKLQQMQDKFDLLKDVEDPDQEGGEGEGSGAGDPGAAVAQQRSGRQRDYRERDHGCCVRRRHDGRNDPRQHPRRQGAACAGELGDGGAWRQARH